jgi:hypothetical protein
METELKIEGGGFPPFSARGCTQELTLAEHGYFKRTINGVLCFLGENETKYKSVIRCQDKTTLVSDGVLGRGQVVRVGCLQRLWQKVKEGDEEVTLGRSAVLGSISVMDANQNLIDFEVVSENRVRIVKAPKQDVFISYRPWLHMRILRLQLFTDEWGLKCGWYLELEEV